MDGNGNGTGKRGRKPSSAATSTRERAAKKLAALEKARDEVRRLEREAAQRTMLIVGREVIGAAKARADVRAWMQELLRQASLSARDRAEIAHLLVDAPETPATSPPAARAAPPAAAGAFTSK